jgi:hypothetical protein
MGLAEDFGSMGLVSTMAGLSSNTKIADFRLAKVSA